MMGSTNRIFLSTLANPREPPKNQESSSDKGSIDAETHFIERQIQRRNLPRINQVGLYNVKDLCLALSWFVRSRSLYPLRRHLILPSFSTLRSLTRAAKNTSDESLFKTFFQTWMTAADHVS